MSEDRMSTVEYVSVYQDWDHREGLTFIEESAVIELIVNGVLFVAGGISGSTLELYINCNDLFWWASADAEPCKPSELESLYKAWNENHKWGVSIWCCMHRNLQPQLPVRTAMSKDGVWTGALSSLPEPSPS